MAGSSGAPVTQGRAGDSTSEVRAKNKVLGRGVPASYGHRSSLEERLPAHRLWPSPLSWAEANSPSRCGQVPTTAASGGLYERPWLGSRLLRRHNAFLQPAQLLRWRGTAFAAPCRFAPTLSQPARRALPACQDCRAWGHQSVVVSAGVLCREAAQRKTRASAQRT